MIQQFCFWLNIQETTWMNVEDIMPRDIHAQSLSHLCLFATPWTVAHQAPMSRDISQSQKDIYHKIPHIP